MYRLSLPGIALLYFYLVMVGVSLALAVTVSSFFALIAIGNAGIAVWVWKVDTT